MNTNKNALSKEPASRAYIQKHREELRKSARASYGLLRVSLVIYGGLIAFFYLLSPFTERNLVPDFSLNIFIAILAMCSLSEIVVRMTEYSCQTYAISKKNEGNCTEASFGKGFAKIIFSTFPFRGIHRNLLALWFFLATYYLILCGMGASEKIYICPENFSLSFFAVVGACMFDFISKALFIFRIPGLGGLVVEFANTAIRSEGNLGSKILDGFLRVFQKISFGKKS